MPNKRLEKLKESVDEANKLHEEMYGNGGARGTGTGQA